MSSGWEGDDKDTHIIIISNKQGPGAGAGAVGRGVHVSVHSLRFQMFIIFYM